MIDFRLQTHHLPVGLSLCAAASHTKSPSALPLAISAATAQMHQLFTRVAFLPAGELRQSAPKANERFISLFFISVCYECFPKKRDGASQSCAVLRTRSFLGRSDPVGHTMKKTEWV